MAISTSARVHPSAIIDPRADIGENVHVGPFAVIDGPVRVGDGCTLGAACHVLGRVTLGKNNVLHSHAVIGGDPQHVKYAGEPTPVEIGDGNTFREGVTVHRAMSTLTRIGHRNYFMANSHVGHDCTVGNDCMFANGALLGGHVTVEDRALISGNSGVHQFVRIGRLALLSGASGLSMDAPPFTVHQRINVVCGVNVIGMRRAGICNGSIDAVRKAFTILYRSGQLIRNSLEQIERQLGDVAEAMEMVAFIRAGKRGISLTLDREAA